MEPRAPFPPPADQRPAHLPWPGDRAAFEPLAEDAGNVHLVSHTLVQCTPHTNAHILTATHTCMHSLKNLHNPQHTHTYSPISQTFKFTYTLMLIYAFTRVRAHSHKQLTFLHMHIKVHPLAYSHSLPFHCHKLSYSHSEAHTSFHSCTLRRPNSCTLTLTGTHMHAISHPLTLAHSHTYTCTRTPLTVREICRVSVSDEAHRRWPQHRPSPGSPTG